MKTKRVSSYKTPADRQFVEDWIARLQALNNTYYRTLTVQGSFGEVSVLAVNPNRPELEPLVILPGARTFGMFESDLILTLRVCKKTLRI